MSTLLPKAGVLLSPKGVWQCVETILVVLNENGMLSISRMLNTHHVQSHTTKNYPAQNANSAKGKKPWPKESHTQKVEHKFRLSHTSLIRP
jgi:hypothetical protein